MCTNFDDPKYLKSIVGKNVSVTIINNEIYTGVLYVIDPLSKTVVIVNTIASDQIVQLIPYNNIKSFEIDSSLIVNPKLSFESSVNMDTLNVCLDKKRQLKDWFIMNQLNVLEENEVLNLKDYKVTIEPPYGPEQCICDNTIVLERIRTLIVKMPL